MDFATIDPTSGSRLEAFSYMPFAEVSHRLDGARAASRAWRDVPIAKRGDVLREVARRLRAECEMLAATATREMGKPIAQARAEVLKCAMCSEYFADSAGELLAEVAAPSNASRSYVAFRPLGVVLAIMPWNYPYWQVFRAAAPALMAGNALVLKHAENTTRCALELERIFREAGAPADLFATILFSNEATDALIADDRIAAVTLTGSERAGIAVGSAAGAALKPSVLELGGSDAFVVRADADLDATAKAAVTARFQNNGQSCIAAKRFIVVDAIYDAFLERFVANAAALALGDPVDGATGLGPVARADLRDTLHAQVRATVDAGATLALGGAPLDRAGYFYQATIVADVVAGMRMFDEEVFGPAAAVIRARDDDHAIELANATTFGLGGSIWTTDVAEGERLAGRLECGCAFVNAIVASDPRLPFGGIKRSGYGRELSAFGLHEFVNIQTVSIG